LTVEPEGRLDPGTYLVRVHSDQVNNSFGNKQLLVVSRLNLALKRTDSEALVWATDLQSGQPVADRLVAIYNDTGRKLGRRSDRCRRRLPRPV